MNNTCDFFNDPDFLSPTLLLEPACMWDAASAFDALPFPPCFSSPTPFPASSECFDLPSISSQSPALSRSGSLKRQAEPEEGEDVKRKRLARKAELAREGRRRKKERITELEKQLADMQLELDREKKRNLATNALQGNVNVSVRVSAQTVPGRGVRISNAIPLSGTCSALTTNVNQCPPSDKQSSMYSCLFLRFFAVDIESK